MDVINSIAGATSSAVGVSSASSKQIMNTQQFLKLLITELTNQDPLEPMKNQDLLEQISSIQSLESTQRMDKSFSHMVDRFDGFINKFDVMLMREQVATASRMIGQVVSGTNTEGKETLGKVVSVKLEETGMLLELDNGQHIRMDHMKQMGGYIAQVSGSDMVGELVLGMTEDGEEVFGTVEAVEVTRSEVRLHLRLAGADANDPTVPILLQSATVINESTAELLIGLHVVGNNGVEVSGVVKSYLVDSEGIKLVLDDADRTVLSLSQVTGIDQGNS